MCQIFGLAIEITGDYWGLARHLRKMDAEAVSSPVVAVKCAHVYSCVMNSSLTLTKETCMLSSPRPSSQESEQ